MQICHHSPYNYVFSKSECRINGNIPKAQLWTHILNNKNTLYKKCNENKEKNKK